MVDGVNRMRDLKIFTCKPPLIHFSDPENFENPIFFENLGKKISGAENSKKSQLFEKKSTHDEEHAPKSLRMKLFRFIF